MVYTLDSGKRLESYKKIQKSSDVKKTCHLSSCHRVFLAPRDLTPETVTVIKTG